MTAVRNVLSKILPYAKAVVGAAAPFFTVWLETGQVDERALGAAAVGLVLVWLTPNKPAAKKARRR